jgi:chemotaxis protein methyltransferase CheR
MHRLNENLSGRDFERMRELILAEAGISLGPEKKTMLEVRLRRRLHHLQLDSTAAYCDLLFTPGGRSKEMVHFIDAVTTNKTDFFREPDHFEHLVAKALPDLDRRRGAARQALVWSAGCSTGEEPYTLAMVLSEYAENHPGFRFRLLASDISTEVLEKAKMGIFKADDVAPVPADLRRKYLMRSREPGSNLIRVIPELRAGIEFRRLNFMDADYGIHEPPEIVFCRNVIIYFDRATQIRILGKLIRLLMPGGYFFAGHSESLQNMDLPLTMAGPAVYRKWG